MKRIFILLLTLVLTIGATACNTSQAQNVETQTDAITVKIGITGESENVIWAPVMEQLAGEGIQVEIINFADYTLLNSALEDGDIDLNAFQHYAFLNQQIADSGYDIVSIGDTYISAMCIYSNSISDISELRNGDTVAIPNDTVNLGRALSVLQGAGVITLGEPAGETYDLEDIAANPLNIQIIEVDGATIPSLLPDVAAGVINGNYALDFDLSPLEDAIFFDDVSLYPDNRYVNNITARTADADNPVYRKIVEAYQSEAVEQVYQTEFAGSYLPGWKSLSAGRAQGASEPSGDAVTVKIGVVGEMYQDLWAPAIAQLAQEGIDIELISFSDYTLPNEALNNGDIDLNGFQHYAYLNGEIEAKGYELTAIGDTILAAMCVYSDKIESLDELEENDKIAIPNDAVNLGRALWVLQGAGLLTLEDVEGSPELEHIVGNPKSIEFVQVDASQIPSLLPDVAAGVINGNYATDFGFKPLEDSIFYDDLAFYTDNRFVNVIAARAADQGSEVYARIVEAFQSDATEQVLVNQFEGAFFPAWK